MRDEKLEHYKQAYEELKLILDMSFDQITIADGNGIFTKVSKSCEKFFGVSEDKLIGSNAFDLEEGGVFDTSVTAEVLRKGEEVTLIQKTGSNKTLMVTGMPVFDEYRKINKIINISRDITEKQMLEDKLKSVKKNLQWFREELNKKESFNKSNIKYSSKPMNKIMELIFRICNLDATVLLSGETGCGKGYLAKVIHSNSSRKNEPFVTINCGAIPETLLESELFGYEKGAFTGASKTGKKGLFEIAGKGTIFLDEIGDMPMKLQVKLLHVLDSKTVLRLGGEKPIDVEGRLIAATNKNLKKLIKEGTFREDLYYRLNVIPIQIPPLRERREDIPNLIRIYLQKYNNENSANKFISEDGYAKLINYDYPGNVRELANIIERLVITTLDDIVTSNNIADIIDPVENNNSKSDEIIPLKESVANFERSILIKAFETHKTTRKVAEVLKIDQSTVVKKAKKLKIKY